MNTEMHSDPNNPAPDAQGLAVTVAAGADSLAPIEADWEELFAATFHEPSTSFEWTRALSRSHVTPSDSLRVIKIHRHAELVAAAALLARRSRVIGLNLTTLSPLSDCYCTHSSVLTNDVSETVSAALVDALFASGLHWDVCRFSRLLEDDPLLPALQAALSARRAWFRTRYSGASYVLALPNSFASYLAGRSPKFRNHLKRTARKVSNQGDVAVLCAERPSEFDAAYELVLAIERHSWKEGNQTSIHAVPHQTQFYRELGRAAAAKGRLHLQVLTIGGVPVAYNYGYLVAGTYSYLKTSYDERFKHLGVATHLRGLLVADLISRGLTRLDFPAEPYLWERQWTDTLRWHRSLVVYNRSLLARALYVRDVLKHRPEGSPPAVQHYDPRALKGSAS